MMHGRRCLALGVRALGVAARRCEDVSSGSCSGGGSLWNAVAGFRSPVIESHAMLLLPALKYSLAKANNFSCCAKVDLPPPREITVEYQEKPENTDYFIQLADGIENANPELMVLGNPEDMQPRDGSFEVTSGHHVLFSKLQTNRLPRVEDILRALEELPTQGLSCELEANKEAATA